MSSGGGISPLSRRKQQNSQEGMPESNDEDERYRDRVQYDGLVTWDPAWFRTFNFGEGALVETWTKGEDGQFDWWDANVRSVHGDKVLVKYGDFSSDEKFDVDSKSLRPPQPPGSEGNASFQKGNLVMHPLQGGTWTEGNIDGYDPISLKFTISFPNDDTTDKKEYKLPNDLVRYQAHQEEMVDAVNRCSERIQGAIERMDQGESACKVVAETCAAYVIELNSVSMSEASYDIRKTPQTEEIATKMCLEKIRRILQAKNLIRYHDEWQDVCKKAYPLNIKAKVSHIALANATTDIRAGEVKELYSAQAEQIIKTFPPSEQECMGRVVHPPIGEHEAHEFKIVSMYNRKGGVCKTTLTHMFAWSLALGGKRVMMVDGDPQCDLSTAILQGYLGSKEAHETFDVPMTGEDSSCSLDHFYDHFSSPDSPCDLYHALLPNLPKKKTKTKLKAPSVFEITSMPASGKPKGLFLLPGHPQIVDYDAVVFNADRCTLSKDGNAIGGWSSLLRYTAHAYKIDVFVVDCSPSIGIMNRTVVMSSDYLITPCTPDVFCYNSICRLGSLLSGWTERTEFLRQHDNHQDKALVFPKDRIPEVRLKFIGVAISGYTGKYLRPTAAFQHYINRIVEKVETIRTDLLQNTVTARLVSETTSYPRLLGMFHDFGPIKATSQQKGVPVPFLGEGMLEKKSDHLTPRDNALVRLFHFVDVVQRTTTDEQFRVVQHTLPDPIQ